MSRRSAGSPRARSIVWLQVAMVCTLVAACGKKSSDAPVARASAAAKPNEVSNGAKARSDSPDVAESGADVASEPKVPGTNPSAPPAEADDTPRRPATVEDARRVLDLTTFPLPEGAKLDGARTIASLKYLAPGDVKSLYEFQRKQLSERGWKALGETSRTDTTAHNTFQKDHFHVTVAVYPESDKLSGVFAISIANFGNIDLTKLPVPPDAKQPYPPSATASTYVTEKSPEETREAVHKLLIEQGWEPYDDPDDVSVYKQNAIQLTTNIGAAATQGGKTMIGYVAQQMSADLPAPPEPRRVTYMENIGEPKQLHFESAAKHPELYEFYRDKLSKAGWKSTSDKPITDDAKWFMIFRNPEKDLIELETREERSEGTIHGTLKHQSAAEVAEIERRIKAERPRIEAELKRKREEEEAKTAKREKDRKDKEAAEKARRRVVVVPPADAKDLKFEADEIKFGVPRGKARAAAESIARQLRDNGWKERGQAKPGTTGSYNFEKDDQSIHIIYLDPGVIPPEVRISGFRVDFHQAGDDEK